MAISKKIYGQTRKTKDRRFVRRRLKNENILIELKIEFKINRI